MAFYLVDYENVNTEGLQGVEQLTAADEVIIFYSEHADRLTFDLHRRLNESKAQIHYFKVGACKKNALDFQLVSYLGYLIAQNSGQSFLYYQPRYGLSERGALLVRAADYRCADWRITACAAAGASAEGSAAATGGGAFADAGLAAVVLDCLQRSKKQAGAAQSAGG